MKFCEFYLQNVVVFLCVYYKVKICGFRSVNLEAVSDTVIFYVYWGMKFICFV